MSRQIEILCAIDIEQTQTSFHAHAIPQHIEPGPGDTILIHDAPFAIAFGETYTGERSATLTRATRLQKFWTKFSSIFEVFELFEVGFQPIADAQISTRKYRRATSSAA